MNGTACHMVVLCRFFCVMLSLYLPDARPLHNWCNNLQSQRGLIKLKEFKIELSKSLEADDMDPLEFDDLMKCVYICYDVV